MQAVMSLILEEKSLTSKNAFHVGLPVLSSTEYITTVYKKVTGVS